jgi:hypothetical protein
MRCPALPSSTRVWLTAGALLKAIFLKYTN